MICSSLVVGRHIPLIQHLISRGRWDLISKPVWSTEFQRNLSPHPTPQIKIVEKFNIYPNKVRSKTKKGLLRMDYKLLYINTKYHIPLFSTRICFHLTGKQKSKRTKKLATVPNLEILLLKNSNVT